MWGLPQKGVRKNDRVRSKSDGVNKGKVKGGEIKMAREIIDIKSQKAIRISRHLDGGINLIFDKEKKIMLVDGWFGGLWTLGSAEISLKEILDMFGVKEVEEKKSLYEEGE